MWDFNRSTWDVEQQTIKDCGLMGWLLLSLVTVNLMEGPYASSDRYKESIERMQALWQTRSGHEMPAFLEAFLDIAIEFGLDTSSSATPAPCRLEDTSAT